MKLPATTPASLSFSWRAALAVAVIVMAFAVPIQMATRAGANPYDDRIRALQQDVSRYESAAASLAQQANTLQTEVDKLNNEKAAIQAQVDISQAKYDQLVAQIAETEKKIKDNQDALGDILADLYLDSQTSTVELLASSNNIGDYINKQEYRSSVRDELGSTIKAVKDLKATLETQKTEAERVLANQKAQRDALADKEAEKQKLLNETQGNEEVYRNLSTQRTNEINELRRLQQQEVSRRTSGGRGYNVVPGPGIYGGYPTAWATAPQNSYVDPWGMYTRQCTSYVAFKVDQVYGNMPYWGGIGNAWEWKRNAVNRGIPTGKIPKPGSVGVLQDGGYGHVAWVESVQPDGTITIDHYNINWSGNYSRWTGLSPTFFDDYIYFGEW